MARAAGPPHVVVGAGVAGLYAALLLARRGIPVRVIERAVSPGGLGACTWFRGLPCDLGSHRLHPAVLCKPLYRELHAAEPLLMRTRRGRILLRGRWMPYPPTALAMVHALGLRTSLEFAGGLLARRSQRQALVAWERDRTRYEAPDADVGFESFVVQRVGEAAYQAFYRPYVEKVWGVPSDQLSQTLAKKRLSTMAPWDFVRQALLGRADAGSRDGPAARQFLYPARGIASMAGYLTRRLDELGVNIAYGEAWDPRAPADAKVLFSGHLRDLVPTSLEHRGLYLVYLVLPMVRVAPIETYYVPERPFWFGRVSELQNYAPALRRLGETVLCVEIPEGAWGQRMDFTTEPQRTTLIEQLVAAGILPAGCLPIDLCQRFVPNVYPLYRRGWFAEWSSAMERVAQLGHVIPFGRQGLFLHCNLDHATDSAAEAVAHLQSGHGWEAWIPRARRALDLRVRD